MKPEWEDYLQSVGLTDVARNTLRNSFKVASLICPVELEDIFFSEYIDDSGQRVFENAWFFAPGFALESKLFLTQEANIDIAPMHNGLQWAKLTWSEFDFEEATAQSRLNLDFRISDEVIGTMRASRENCLKLSEIYFKCFKRWTEQHSALGA